MGVLGRKIKAGKSTQVQLLKQTVIWQLLACFSKTTTPVQPDSPKRLVDFEILA